MCNLETIYHKNGLEKFISIFTRMFSSQQLTKDIISINNPNHCKRMLNEIKDENYIVNYYLNQGFTKKSCPEYLKEKNFYKLKAKILDKEITYYFINNTVTNFLKNHKKKDIDISYLLDQPEFLTRIELIEQFNGLSKKATSNHIGILKTTQKRSRIYNILKNSLNISSIHIDYYDDSDFLHNQNTFLYKFRNT